VIIEIFLSIILGIIFGIIFGLIPGLHINLINTLLVTNFLYHFSKEVNPLYLGVFIISLAVSNIFFSFIPSIFLGCPEEETSLSVLPGHRLLMKGHGYKALRISSKGILIGSIILIFLTPILIFLIPLIYPHIEKVILYLLIISSLILILKEENKKISFLIFCLSGVLGYFCLNLNANQPLFPLFTGLFGVPILLNSLNREKEITKQKITEPKINIKLKFIFSSILSSVICGFLPGLGTSQAIILGNIFQKMNSEIFLFNSGIVNILILGISIICLFLINKTRTGSAVAIKEIFKKINLKEVYFFIFLIVLVSFISYFLIKKISKNISLNLNKISYKKISFIFLIILGLLIIFISGIKGVLILFVSSLLGIYSNYFKIRKSQLMGCLLIPTIIYYLINF
jgi:putative membrane protein